MAWSEKAIDHGALMLYERDNSAGAACEPRCETCKLIAKQVLDAAAAVDGDAQWNGAIEAALKSAHAAWDKRQRPENMLSAIRSLKRG